MASDSSISWGADGTSRPDRATFSARELRQVCAAYPFGELRSIRALERGTPTSAKVVVDSDAGVFVLKRYSAEASDPFHIAAVHSVMLRLRAEGLPIPALLGTEASNNSLLQHGAYVYEAVEYVEGSRFDHGVERASSAGRVLGEIQSVLRNHDGVDRTRIPRTQVPTSLGQLGPASDRLSAMVGDLGGLARLTDTQPLHGDWHPGNLLFDGDRVAAVIDFGGIRLGSATGEALAGATQFALAGEPGVATIDPAVFASFFGAWLASGPGMPRLSRADAELWARWALLAEAGEALAGGRGIGRLDYDQSVSWLVGLLEQVAGCFDAIEPDLWADD